MMELYTDSFIWLAYQSINELINVVTLQIWQHQRFLLARYNLAICIPLQISYNSSYKMTWSSFLTNVDIACVDVIVNGFLYKYSISNVIMKNILIFPKVFSVLKRVGLASIAWIHIISNSRCTWHKVLTEGFKISFFFIGATFIFISYSSEISQDWCLFFMAYRRWYQRDAAITTKWDNFRSKCINICI